MAAQAVRAWLANGYTGGLKVEVRVTQRCRLNLLQHS